jgi:Response regulator containing a CheY-like receiver domain and an HTH DNA-binding domain
MAAAKLNILPVDDSEFIRIGLRYYLEKQNYIVHEASNIADALYLFDHIRPETAILDISLEVGPDGKEGLYLAREIKARAADVGIVLLSGDPSHYQEFLEISRKYRGIAYLYKGNNFQNELLSVIELVSKGGVWVAPEVASYEESSVSIPISKEEQSIIKRAMAHFDELTNKEIEIIESVAMPHENDEIAKQKHLSPNTVSVHLTHIYSKLGLGEEWSSFEKRALLTKTYWLRKKTKE